VWLKSAIDDRQEALIHEIAPAAKIKRVSQSLDFSGLTHTPTDLILVINVIRNLDIRPSYLRKLWHSAFRNRNALFDVILAKKRWIGLNDRTLNMSFLGLVDGWQILPQRYWEFPKGIQWYMCYYSADDMNWLPSGKLALAEQNKNVTQDAVYSVIEYVYTDIRGKRILDLSGLLDTDTVDDVLNLPILHQHYDIVLGLGLLSRIEQYERFTHYVIRRVNADVYIFSGIEPDNHMPVPLLHDGQVGGIERTYRHYSRLNADIKREFNYNSYIIRGASPKEFMDATVASKAHRGREVYIVIEASYQIPETIAWTAGF